jgi:hypothetical protein
MNNLYLGKNILVVTHEEIIKTIIRLLNNYSIDEFENQEVPIGTPIVFELASNTRNLFNGYYLSSPLLEKNADYHHQSFPTGFGIDSGKANSTKDIIKKSLLPDVDLLPSKENFISTIDPSLDTISKFSKARIINRCNDIFIQILIRSLIRK